MQRGKAPVQHYKGGMPTLFRASSGGGTATVMCCKEGAPTRSETGEDEPELAGHIVEQLRSTYDALLQEPIPDHLRMLLANLSDTEEKS